jgi:hypothetical protein
MSEIGSSPIRCAIRPSVLLTAFLFFGHLIAFLELMALALAVSWKLALGLLLAASACHSVYQVWHPRVDELIADANGLLGLVWKGQEPQLIEVSEETLVLPWLIVLRFRLNGERLAKSLVLPLDGLGQRDNHRLLRRWLRWRLAVKQAAGR